MKTRNVRMLIGAAAFLAVGAAAGWGQDTTTTRTSTAKRTRKTATSDTRIPVTKEAQGEVVPRVDTVTMYRTDTVTVSVAGPVRVDTVATTITRYDTTRIETLPGYLIERGGFYAGLGAGASFAYGSIRNVNQPGWNTQAQLGWQPAHSVLGLRGDVNYTMYSDDGYGQIEARPDVLTGNLDLKLTVPVFQALFGAFPNFSLYAIGGGSYFHTNNLRSMLETGACCGVGAFNAVKTGPENQFGWNAGGGMSWHFGSKELFAEMRLLSFVPLSGEDRARHAPLTLGVNWY